MSDLSKRHPQRDFADGFRAYKRGEPRDGTTAAWLEGWDAAAAVAERDALRAELAADREVARTKLMDAAYWQERAEAAETKRNALRALLEEAIQHVSVHHSTLRWQIYLALKGDGE